MSAASNAAALPYDPDPPPDTDMDADMDLDTDLDPVADHAPEPSRNNRLLGFLRKLIDYGTQLVHSLQQRTAATALVTVVLRFGTRDIALILSRIARGLQLANALEAKLIRRPVRQDPVLIRTPSERKPRTDEPPAKPRASRAVSRLPDLPTAEEIAAALRNRPIGAVIADICRDLGIVPADPLWGEVMMVVVEYGGNLAKLYTDVFDRLFGRPGDPSAFTQDGWPVSWPEAEVACATGPP